MKQNLTASFFLAFILVLACFARAQEPKLHRLDMKSTEQLHRFFKYEEGKTVVSGHRGTVELGFPENSIAGMEAVLKHTPAFFEIDPRFTKDSVIVLMHDATLDRTTNGTGQVSDYTWDELKQLRLKDKDGHVTPYRIPTLAEVIEWARGKTILNLDQKGVPVEVSAELIRKHRAHSFVMVTVHSPEQANQYLALNKDQMLSAHILSLETLAAYEAAEVPFNRMIAYIGPRIKPENQQLYKALNAKGVMCMISAAPTYDKLETKEARAEAYRAIFADGASILESDLPIEVGEACRLGLILTAVAQPNEEKYPLSDAKRILFLGNSITYAGAYIALFESFYITRYPDAKAEIINAGLPSETVSGLSEPNHADGAFPRPWLFDRLTDALEKTKPDVVFACYGMNDGIYLPFDEKRFDAYKAGIEHLRKALEEVGVKRIIFLTPPIHDDPEKGLEGYNVVLDAYAHWLLEQRVKRHWEVIDLHGPMRAYLVERRRVDPAFRLADDGVHPGDEGHWLMAKALMTYFDPAAGRFPSRETYLNSTSEMGDLYELVRARQAMMKDTWLTHIGHRRPGMNKGLGRREAKKQYRQIQKQIQKQIDKQLP